MTDGPWLSEDAQLTWRSFVSMRRALETHLSRHMQNECGLSPSDFEILVNLSETETGQMRAVDLVKATQWEKSRMSHHLSRMEKRDLIRREDGAARYPDIALTERGWDAIRTCAPANAARVRELFVEPIGPDRLSILNQAFNDVIAAVRTHENDEDCARPRN